MRLAILRLLVAHPPLLGLEDYLQELNMATENETAQMDPSKLVPLADLQQVCAELEKFIEFAKVNHPSRASLIEKAEKCLGLYKIKLARALVTGTAG